MKTLEITLSFEINDKFYNAEFEVIKTPLHILNRTFNITAIDEYGENIVITLEEKRELLQYIKDNKINEIMEQI